MIGKLGSLKLRTGHFTEFAHSERVKLLLSYMTDSSGGGWRRLTVMALVMIHLCLETWSDCTQDTGEVLWVCVLDGWALAVDVKTTV